MSSEKKRETGLGVLLVDMDGTVADLDGSLERAVKQLGHDTKGIRGRTEFEYEAKVEAIVKPIMAKEGFFQSFSPFQGAVEALKRLQKSGWQVFFCTSPLKEYEFCVVEKFKWVEQHFGREWTRRIIVTKDKTIVSGDFLIDDKPGITGVAQPKWKQIYFDQSYNQKAPGPRIKSWTDVDFLLNSLK